MAYQEPSYCFHHPAYYAGTSGITTDIAVSSEYALFDGRPSSLCIWSASSSSAWIKIHRPSGTIESADRVIIPAGHNLSGAIAISLYKNTSDSFPSGATFCGFTTSLTGMINFTLDTVADYDWLWLTITGTGTWEIGQLYITVTRTPTLSKINPNWSRRHSANLTEIQFPEQSATLATAPNNWVWDISYDNLYSTDLAIFDELIDETGGGVRPFYFIPPDTTLDPVLVKIANYQKRKQSRPVPQAAAGLAYSISFSLIEQTA